MRIMRKLRHCINGKNKAQSTNQACLLKNPFFKENANHYSNGSLDHNILGSPFMKADTLIGNTSNDYETTFKEYQGPHNSMENFNGLLQRLAFSGDIQEDDKYHYDNYENELSNRESKLRKIKCDGEFKEEVALESFRISYPGYEKIPIKPPKILNSKALTKLKELCRVKNNISKNMLLIKNTDPMINSLSSNEHHKELEGFLQLCKERNNHKDFMFKKIKNKISPMAPQIPIQNVERYELEQSQFEDSKIHRIQEPKPSLIKNGRMTKYSTFNNNEENAYIHKIPKNPQTDSGHNIVRIGISKRSMEARNLKELKNIYRKTSPVEIVEEFNDNNNIEHISSNSHKIQDNLLRQTCYLDHKVRRRVDQRHHTEEKSNENLQRSSITCNSDFRNDSIKKEYLSREADYNSLFTTVKEHEIRKNNDILMSKEKKIIIGLKKGRKY